MPIFLAGKRNKPAARRGSSGQAGVTLIEMMIVVVIAGLLTGLVFPSVASGLESLRLRSASDSLVSFLNGALNRADRREEVMEVVVSPSENTIRLYSAKPGFERTLKMPEGVTIEAVLPELADPQEGPRSFMLMPGGVPPRIGVELRNRRGARRIVRVDPITGVPQVEVLETK